jgi:hypothetical protein
MNVPVVTFEMPSWQVPSGPGIVSPHTLTELGASLNRTPPGRQMVVELPGGIVTVPPFTWQTCVSGVGGGVEPGLGHAPGTGDVGLGFGQ